MKPTPKKLGTVRVTAVKIIASKYFLALCLLTGFLVRLVWISYATPQPIQDCQVYYSYGLDLASGKGYTAADQSPTAYWPVGYPFFLSVLFRGLGGSPDVAKFANVMIYMGILYLSYVIARRMFSSQIAGRVTVLLLILYPIHIAYMSLLVSEPLLTFLILLGVFLLMRAQDQMVWTVAAGLIFGFAGLVKPQAALIPALYFLIVLGKAIRNRGFGGFLVRAGLVHVFMVLALAPWLIRNYRVFGHFPILSTNGGINLMIGNNPSANGGYNWDATIASPLANCTDEYTRDRKARSLAVDYFIKNPRASMKLWWDKFKSFAAPDWVGIRWNVNGMRERPMHPVMYWMAVKIVQLNPICWWIMKVGFGLSVVGLIYLAVRRRRGGEFPVLGLAIILYFTALSLVFFGEPRFHFPVVPWMAMYIGGLAGRIVGGGEKNA